MFNKFTKGVENTFGIKIVSADNSHSEEELREIVSASARDGQLNHVESRLIDNVFDFADRVAREVMIPRCDMVCLDIEDSLADNMDKMLATHHTRYPVVSEDKDHVLGIIHVRNFIGLSPDSDVDLRDLMGNVIAVPESMEISKVLQTMQQNRVQMVIVADEYGGTAGLLTMEDLLEEIVGDIKDEHDEERDEEVLECGDGSYEFDGVVLLDEITDLLNIEFEDPEEDTLGGYIFGLLERKPEIGDKIEVDGWSFEVLQTDGFRVVRVRAEQFAEKSFNEDD